MSYGELLCKHHTNRKSFFWYILACEVLKWMPDKKRVKVLVLTDRYGKEVAPHVKYVEANRVRNLKPFPKKNRRGETS